MMRRLRPVPVEEPEIQVLREGPPLAAGRTIVWPLPVQRSRGIGRALWSIAGPAAVAGVVLLLSWSVLGSKVSVYLPPDGAHYLADADALVGGGVRPLRHPPAFPALVAVTRAVAGEVGGFQLAMLASLALLTVALYVLLRRWVGRGASLLGASLGVLLPTTAELLGWGGGATLLAIACLVLSLAALENWVDGRRSGGALTGGALALTALAHPFVFGVALLCIGVRWLSVLVTRRRFGLGWDPLGLKGIASAALPLVPAVVAAAPYYLSVEGGGGFALGPPRPAGLAELLRWAFGADPLPWLLLPAAILAIVVYGGKGLVVSAATLGGLTIVMATSLSADLSYVTRVAYLIPVIVAGGVGVGAEHLGRWLGERIRPVARRKALLAAGSALLVAALGLASYGPRLERAGTFYQFLEPSDVQGLRALGDAEGVVATSWHDNEYGTGVSTSWFVEGLAERSSFGPTAPWLSTVPEQRAAGQDMQRLFAGTEGVENGAVQVTSGPPGVRADPAIQVRSDGFYFPLLFGNSLVNGHPIAYEGDPARQVVGLEIRWTYRDGRGREVLSQVARLEGDRVLIEYALAAEAEPGPWSVWFWPAYGVHWKDVRTGTGEVQARQGLPEEDVSFGISVESGEVVYHRVEERFLVEAIEVRAEEARALSIVIDIEARARPGVVRAFDEQAILDQHDVSDVIVWKDTGWRDRFDLTPCYALVDETTGLLFYRVVDACAGATP